MTVTSTLKLLSWSPLPGPTVGPLNVDNWMGVKPSGTSDSSTSGSRSLGASKSMGLSVRPQRVEWMQASRCSFRNGTTLAGFRQFPGINLDTSNLILNKKTVCSFGPFPTSCHWRFHHSHPRCRCGERCANHFLGSLQMLTKIPGTKKAMPHSHWSPAKNAPPAQLHPASVQGNKLPKLKFKHFLLLTWCNVRTQAIRSYVQRQIRWLSLLTSRLTGLIPN